MRNATKLSKRASHERCAVQYPGLRTGSPSDLLPESHRDDCVPLVRIH